MPGSVHSSCVRSTTGLFHMRRDQRREKRAMKQLLALVVVLSLVSVLIGACGGSSAGTSSPAPTEVHMGQTNFVQSSVSISKGGSISLIDDVASTHIIANGTWQGSTPKPGAEAGAPPANHLHFT